MNISPVRIAGAGAVVALGLGLAACAPSEEGAADTALSLGVPFDVNSWDPTLNRGTPAPMEAVYDPLLVVGTSGEVEPWLVTEWAIDDAGTTVTMELRENVTFSDGEVFDAEAAKAGIEHYRAAGTPAYGSISEVEVIDEDTVALHLNAPDPGLIVGMADNSYIPSPAIVGTDANQTEPVGSGPYVLDDSATVAGSSYTFSRNPDYWNSSAFPFDTLTLTVLGDATARLNAVQSGQVDAIMFATPAMIGDAEAADLSVQTAEIDWVGYVVTDRNGAIHPAFGKKEVRQAMAHALDREAILEAVDKGMGRVTNQVFSEGSDAYDPELEELYAYDPERAKELLAEAGYPNGVTLPIPASEADRPYQPLIEQYFKAVGITPQWETVPLADYFNAVSRYGMFSMRMASTPSAYLDAANHYGFTSVMNTNKQHDPRVEAMLEAARVAQADEQEALLRELNRHVVDEAYVIPWYRVAAISISSAAVDVDFQTAQGKAMPSLRVYGPAD